MKVSVLMSVYNGADFLMEAIESVFEQTYENFEFIIVDDGSTDETSFLLENIQDERVNIIWQENRGLAAALNRGLMACTSDIVVRMDADDISYPYRIEKLLTEWKEHNQPDVFGSGADYINSKGKYLWSYTVPTEHTDIVEMIVSGAGMAMIHPSVLFRKNSVMAVGGYDASFNKNSEDFDLWLRLSATCSFGNSVLPLIKYRISGHQTTGKMAQESGGLWGLLALQKKYLADNGLADIWDNERAKIESALRKRIIENGYGNIVALRRRLTEIKVDFRGGHKANAVRSAIDLLRHQPVPVLNEIFGTQKQFFDRRTLILNKKDLLRLGLLAEI